MLYDWHNISELVSGLEDNSLKEVSVDEKKVGLLKKADIVFAFAATCPHSGAPLCDGWLDAKGHIVCPLHKYKFNPVNGYNSTGEGYKLRTFPGGGSGWGVLCGTDRLTVFNRKDAEALRPCYSNFPQTSQTPAECFLRICT